MDNDSTIRAHWSFWLIGVIATMVYVLSSGVNFSNAEIFGVILMPLIIAIFLIWYAKTAKKKSWIA